VFGPAATTWALLLHKNPKVTEAMKIEPAAVATNAFNHVHTNIR
jgi:hypothetical protein